MITMLFLKTSLAPSDIILSYNFFMRGHLGSAGESRVPFFGRGSAWLSASTVPSMGSDMLFLNSAPVDDITVVCCCCCCSLSCLPQQHQESSQNMGYLA